MAQPSTPRRPQNHHLASPPASPQTMLWSPSEALAAEPGIPATQDLMDAISDIEDHEGLLAQQV